MKNIEQQVKQVLKQYWGYENFRGKQFEIIESVLNGIDTLALMPTGGGKSICFQVPGMVKDGLTIVISPLIALMDDQVEALKKKNIKAYALHSGYQQHEIDQVLDNCIYGEVKFLYIAPERLSTELFIERIQKMNVSLVAVDEAHCISQWGYDFRPSYLNINNIRDLLPEVPVLALTASATQQVQKDIAYELNFRPQHQLIKQSFTRENLIYVALESETKLSRLVSVLSKVNGSAVVYVRNRRGTKEIAEFLNKRNIDALFYHAGLNNKERLSKQKAWQKNQVRVMVATNAFGMGIDKPDVRLVVHMDVPDSPEAYFQEAGRGGRDGELAYAVLLWNKHDYQKLIRDFEEKYPPKEQLNELYQKLASHLKVAIGEMSNRNYPIVLKNFADACKQSVSACYNQLKTLEWCGFIEIRTKGMLRSSVRWVASIAKAQEMSENNKVLAYLIRSGHQFFDDQLYFSEEKLAASLNISEEELIQQLKWLKNQGWINYQVKATSAMVRFIQPRIEKKRFQLPAILFKTLKEQDEQRRNFMLNYLQTNHCRSVALMEYFGEKNTTPCNKCDVCTHYTGELSTDEKKKLIAYLQESLNTKTLSLPELCQDLKPVKQKKLSALVRELVDSGTLIINDDGKISLSKNNM